MTPWNVAPGWRALLVPLLVVAATCAVYWPGLGGGFVFDDFPNIVDNPGVRVASLQWRELLQAMFSSEAGTLQRPLAMLSFALNYHAAGMDPWAMKLTNLAIHALNAVLAWWLLRSLLSLAAPQRREWPAAFAAAAWALHPINLLAVLYVVQRMESLAHTFVFAGLIAYLSARRAQLAGRPAFSRLAGSLAAFTALGLLSKESAALLPLYALLVEAILPGLRFRGAPRQLGFVFTALLVLPGAVGGTWLLLQSLEPSAYAHRTFTLAERLLTEPRVLCDYLRWSVFPTLQSLGLYHDDIPVSRGLLSPPSTLAAMLALAALAAAAVVLRNRRPLAALGMLWFFAAHLLTATFIPLELVYEHRNYFASVGVMLVLADLLLVAPTLPSWRRMGATLAALLLAWFGMTTLLRAREWSDPMRFVETEALKRPHSPRAAYALGQFLVIADSAHPDPALARRAAATLEQARQLPGSDIMPAQALLLMAAHGRIPAREEWWDDIVQRLRAEPIGAQQVSAIGALTRCARDRRCDFPTARMAAMFDAALSHGDNAEVLNIRADYVLNVTGDAQAALALWDRAIALSPRTAQYRINRARLLIALGRQTEAREAIAQLRQLGRWGQYERAALELEARRSPGTRP